jgi:hypothetical protein
MEKSWETLLCSLPVECTLFHIYCSSDFWGMIVQTCDLIWKYRVFLTSLWVTKENIESVITNTSFHKVTYA